MRQADPGPRRCQAHSADCSSFEDIFIRQGRTAVGRAERRSGGATPAPLSRLLELAGRDWSCSPRKTCPAIGSCEEANWYLQNCAWGGKLDRDNDGIPCESLC
ncbi:excalibur calcium-binding domain-containing protein [Paracoccus yeei]|uniref:excalibur calcium-binding domain-containing protein n=1 Tax=Paracoccus yeei TaxID=147645 RepID=UPI001CD2DBAD